MNERNEKIEQFRLFPVLPTKKSVLAPCVKLFVGDKKQEKEEIKEYFGLHNFVHRQKKSEIRES